MGEVYICPGKRQVFTCQVTLDTSLPNRLMWRIHFQGSLNENDIVAVFLPSDLVGHIIENRETFVFNLTSSSQYTLESTLTVNIDSNIMSLNGATVSCSKGIGASQQTVIHILNGNIADIYISVTVYLVYDIITFPL